MTLFFASAAISQEDKVECSRNYEYEILENLNDETLKGISQYYKNKSGICDVNVITKNSDFFIVITTTEAVDQISINLLTRTALSKFKIKTKKCEDEKL